MGIGVRVKTHLELNLERFTRGNKESLYRYINSKRKPKENVGLLLNRTGNLVTKDMEKAKVLSAYPHLELYW